MNEYSKELVMEFGFGRGVVVGDSLRIKNIEGVIKVMIKGGIIKGEGRRVWIS